MSGNNHYVAIWASDGENACAEAASEMQEKYDDWLCSEWAVSEKGEVYIHRDCNNEPDEDITIQDIEREIVEYASQDFMWAKEAARRWADGEDVGCTDMHRLSNCIQVAEEYKWSVEDQETFRDGLSLFYNTPYKFGATNTLDWYKKGDDEELWVVCLYVHS